MAIRRDIYAVKSRQSRSEPWCFVFMTKDVEQAKNKLSVERVEVTRLGYNGQAELVHPSQNIVNYYVAAGNVLS